MTGEPEGEDALNRLTSSIAQCRICRDHPAGGADRRLPHEPRPVVTVSSTARILIAGQAPGLRVHETGLPFNDRSGDRLRDWMGVDRAAFYDARRFAILPMGFCFPGYDAKGSDLPPRRECARQWRRDAMAVMPQIELVLAIGHYAQKWHLAEACDRTLTETVRNWRKAYFSNHFPRILPLPHPSWRNTFWLKKNPWFEADVLPVLKDAVRTFSVL